MDTYIHSFDQGLIGNSASTSTSKTLKTRQFLNRFNQLPSYNAIHSKNPKEITHQSEHYKNYQTKNNNSLFKLKLDALKNSNSKNSNSKLNMSSSDRQKSQRKIRILNALMNTFQGQSVSEKYQSSPTKFHFQRRETIPLAQEILKNMKLKSNIERLSLKIKQNYYPGKDGQAGSKKQQRFSYTPLGIADKKYQNNDLKLLTNKQDIRVIQKDRIYCIRPKMAKSFIRLKCIASEDNQKRNIRQSKITSNLLVSIKNSKIEQINNDYSKIKLKTEKRLIHNSKSQTTKGGQANAESMKNLYGKQSYNVILGRQKINKKTALKLYDKFKILKTQLNQSQKQNYQPKMNSSAKSSYITKFIKTSVQQMVNNPKQCQEQQINNDHRHFISQMNPISLLHPEGEFANHFQSQFNPW